MHSLFSLPAGLLIIFGVNIVLVTGWWWWSRGKGMGPWMRRAAGVALGVLSLTGGTISYRAAMLRQAADEARIGEQTKEVLGLRTDLTNALVVNRVQEAKLATLERTASEQKQLDAERAAALEADLQKAMSDIGAMFNERNGVIELVLKDGVVNFDTDLSTLQCEGKERLSRVVGAISRVLDAVDSITIVGHTDMRGSADHNKQLSKQRADAVLKYLADSGIPKNMMTGVGKSYMQPAGFDAEQSMAVIKKANENEKLMSENRRVQLLIRRKATQPQQ
jgi:outer membrane protein OmpA-like peptidoglycan-associated protein